MHLALNFSFVVVYNHVKMRKKGRKKKKIE